MHPQVGEGFSINQMDDICLVSVIWDHVNANERDVTTATPAHNILTS